MQPPRNDAKPFPIDQLCHMDHIPDIDLDDSAAGHLSAITG